MSLNSSTAVKRFNYQLSNKVKQEKTRPAFVAAFCVCVNRITKPEDDPGEIKGT